jgi:hypothetical protein
MNLCGGMLHEFLNVKKKLLKLSSLLCFPYLSDYHFTGVKPSKTFLSVYKMNVKVFTRPLQKWWNSWVIKLSRLSCHSSLKCFLLNYSNINEKFEMINELKLSVGIERNAGGYWSILFLSCFRFSLIIEMSSLWITIFLCISSQHLRSVLTSVNSPGLLLSIRVNRSSISFASQQNSSSAITDVELTVLISITNSDNSRSA